MSTDFLVLTIVLWLILTTYNDWISEKLLEFETEGFVSFDRERNGYAQFRTQFTGLIALPILAIVYAIYGFQSGFQKRSRSILQLFISFVLGQLLVLVTRVLSSNDFNGFWTFWGANGVNEGDLLSSNTTALLIQLIIIFLGVSFLIALLVWLCYKLGFGLRSVFDQLGTQVDSYWNNLFQREEDYLSIINQNQKILSENVQFELFIDARFSGFDEEKIKVVIDDIQNKTGASNINFVNVFKGSVRLVLECKVEDFEKIVSSFLNNELDKYPIVSINLTNSNTSSRNELQSSLSRELSEDFASGLKKLENLIEENNVDLSIKQQFYSNKSKYHQLEKHFGLGVIDYQAYQLVFSKLLVNIFDIVAILHKGAYSQNREVKY